MSKIKQNLKQRLTQALDTFFEMGFAITPLLGNKAPYRNNWQHEEPLSKETLIREINSGRSTSNSLKKAIFILYERKRRLWSLSYLSALELALSFDNVVTLKSAKFSPAV